MTAVKDVPRRLVVLGGGAAGVEMAQAMHRLGSEEVTVIEAYPRLLGREEPFAGKEVRAALEAEGVTVVTGTGVQRVSREAADGPVTVELADGRLFVGDEHRGPCRGVASAIAARRSPVDGAAAR